VERIADASTGAPVNMLSLGRNVSLVFGEVSNSGPEVLFADEAAGHTRAPVKGVYLGSYDRVRSDAENGNFMVLTS
jgi:hypothetical protein